MVPDLLLIFDTQNYSAPQKAVDEDWNGLQVGVMLA